MSRKTKMNVLTSDELIKQVNPENLRLKDDFISYLKSVQRSPKTIYCYENDLDIFFVWNLQFNRDKFFTNITKRDLVAYQNWLLNTNGNSSARVRRLKSSLSSLSNFIENVLDDEFPNFRNIVGKIENPVNQPIREKTILSDEDINKLLQHLVTTKKYEKACAVALAAYSGRRKSELGRFKVSDFNDSHLICEGALYKSSPIKTKGKDVNGKMLECYTLAKKFKPYLDLWMEERKEKGIESEWLLVDLRDTSKPIEVSTLNSWANSFSKFLGVPWYWHCMRHACCTRFLEENLPEGVVQSLIGWDSSDMVRLYDDRSTDSQLEKYFNKDGIKKIEHKDIKDL